MFENMMKFIKKFGKKENKVSNNSRDAAKERLHLVLMQDRANVSADFLELMKQEIIDVIKKYIDVDEREIDVRLTNKENGDGTNGAPALYANIPILNIKNESRKIEVKKEETIKEDKKQEKQESISEENKKEENKNQEETSSNSEVKKKEKEENINKKENQKNLKEESKKTKEKIKSENN